MKTGEVGCKGMYKDFTRQTGQFHDIPVVVEEAVVLNLLAIW